MKNLKKIASVFLALVMTLALCVPAFAAPAETYTLTINGVGSGYTYVAYQIFSGDLAMVEGEKVLSNIQWGSGVNKTKIADFTFEGKSGAADIADYLSEHSNEDTAKAFATAISSYLAAPTKQTNECTVGGTEDKPTYTYEMTGLAAGYYLVQNSAVPTGDHAFTSNILEVVANTEVTQKGNVPTSDKKIIPVDENDKTEISEDEKTSEAAIGDTVKYEITGTLPSNYADYDGYYYEFTDTLSKGLTFDGKDSVTVKVVNGDNSVDVTESFYIEATEYNAVTGTNITISIADLNKIPGVTINAESKIVVTYTATLNENAVIAGEGNPNDVQLVYPNDPNKKGSGTGEPGEKPTKPDATGETPKSTVKTYTTELTITKRANNEEGAFLPGTEFTLSGEGTNVVLVTTESFEKTEDGSGDYWKLKDGTYTKDAPIAPSEGNEGNEGNEDLYESTTVKYAKTTTVTAKGNGKTETNITGTINADGTVTFQGLGAGKYTLSESKTLDGYNTIPDIDFEISFDAENAKFSTNNEQIKVGEGANVIAGTIVNKSGSTLPETGGIGTTIFYAVGGLLVVGAGVLLVTRKRVDDEQ